MAKYFIAILLLIFRPGVSDADIVIGGDIVYRVVKGDSIEFIGAKLGVSWKNIVKDNDLDINKYIHPGQELVVNTRRIIPKTVDNGIIINIADKMLYYFKNNSLAMAFPVGLGMPSWKGITRWRTPVGKFEIIGKRKNPTWRVPLSMQWKMKMEGKPVKTIVPPGRDNPLGRFAIDTSIPSVVIHETIWPTSVYQYSSHGCIRVLPENMEEFFKDVDRHTPGELIYEPVKIAVSDQGRIFMEVHRDVYGRFNDLRIEAIRLIEEKGISDRVDWQKVDAIIQEKTGIAVDVTL